MYIIMESELQPKSTNNMLFKYADDANPTVLEHSDVSVLEEFEHIKYWAIEKRLSMIPKQGECLPMTQS